MGEFRHLATHS